VLFLILDSPTTPNTQAFTDVLSPGAFLCQLISRNRTLASHWRILPLANSLLALKYRPNYGRYFSPWLDCAEFYSFCCVRAKHFGYW